MNIQSGRFNKIPKNELTKALSDGFEESCLWLIIEGYKLMKNTKEYEKMYKEQSSDNHEEIIELEEDNFTASLIGKIKTTPRFISLELNNHLEIIPQFQIYSSEIYSLRQSAKSAPRVDFKIGALWFGGNISNFYVESKLLVEKDWITPKGTKKNASQMTARYITTGIDNFSTGRYPSKSCLIAYVIYGTNEGVFDNLNKALKVRYRDSEILKDQHTINGNKDCYRSYHSNDIIIRHLFLNFHK